MYSSRLRRSNNDMHACIQEYIRTHIHTHTYYCMEFLQTRENQYQGTALHTSKLKGALVPNTAGSCTAATRTVYEPLVRRTASAAENVRV